MPRMVIVSAKRSQATAKAPRRSETFRSAALFQQSAKDVTVFGVVGGVLITVAILASSIPARRAIRVDPNTVLRAD